MGAIGAVLLVAFVIICVFSVLLVLVQEPDSSGMGGMLGGGNSQAFGSHSASVLTKTTVVFIVLFLLLTFLLALLNKGSKLRTDLSDVATESGIGASVSDDGAADWWRARENAADALGDAGAETSAPVEAEEAAPGAESADGERTGLLMNTESEAVVAE